MNTGSSGCVGAPAPATPPRATVEPTCDVPGTFCVLGLVTDVGLTDEPGCGGDVSVSKLVCDWDGLGGRGGEEVHCGS